jgi:hypothetical protein
MAKMGPTMSGEERHACRRGPELWSVVPPAPRRKVLCARCGEVVRSPVGGGLARTDGLSDSWSSGRLSPVEVSYVVSGNHSDVSARLGEVFLVDAVVDVSAAGRAGRRGPTTDVPRRLAAG